MSNWPHYSRYMKYYEKYSRRLNGVLYSMCADMPGHWVEGEIWGKVWIIGRSYPAASNVTLPTAWIQSSPS